MTADTYARRRLRTTVLRVTAYENVATHGLPVLWIRVRIEEARPRPTTLCHSAQDL